MRKSLILIFCLLLTFSLIACDMTDNGPHEHKYMSRKVIPASCKAEGEKLFVCECGDQYTETSPRLDHTYGDWETIVKPTMTATGTAIRKCSGCGNKEEKILDILTIEEEISGYTEVLLEMPEFTAPEDLTAEQVFNWALMNAEIISSGYNSETYMVTRKYSMGELTRMTKHYLGLTIDFESVYIGNDSFIYKEYDDTLTWILDASGGWPNYSADTITKIDDAHYTMRYAVTDLGEEKPFLYGNLNLTLVDGRFIITSHTVEQ